MDQYTEEVREGLGTRLLQSVKGLIVGVVLFLAAFPVLWLNEGYAVKTARSLSQGANDVVSVAPDRIGAANEGKLVHVSGRATTTETVADPVFNVSVRAVRLRRKVEMYQWQETSTSQKDKDFGGGQTTRTTYKYAPVWSEQPIDSANFKRPEGHQNPAMPLRSDEYVADRVTLGAFRLNRNQVDRFTGDDAVDVSGARPPDSIRDRAHSVESGFQVGDLASPAVGDLRITFKQLTPVEVTVVARQVSDTFEPYRAKAGGTIDLVAMGIQSAEAMFETAKFHNVVRTWILRGVGLILMIIGMALVLKPLATLGDVVPFVGSLLRVGAGLLSFGVALCLSLVTIAIAWIAYRPLIGLALLTGAVLVIFGTARFRKSGKSRGAMAGVM